MGGVVELLPIGRNPENEYILARTLLWRPKRRWRPFRNAKKYYADQRRRELCFKIGDHVYLKVTPFKGTQRFQGKGKLAPRYVAPFRILATHGAVAYQLELAQSLSTIHDVFHVTQLKKCLRVPIEATNYEDIDIQPNLSYKEHPIWILDRAEHKTRNKTTKFVKIQWNHHSEREATWEQEDQLQQSYPNLFMDEYMHS